MIPQTLTNMNLFIDGRGYTGRVLSLTLPVLSRTTDEMRAGGMDGPVEIGMGIELMAASFNLAGIDRDSLVFFGLADDTACGCVFRGSFKDQKGAVVAAVATLRGMLKEIDMGEWTPGQRNESTYNLSPSYYKLEVDGRVVYELDPMNCVRIVNGVDEAAAERAAIGL